MEYIQSTYLELKSMKVRKILNQMVQLVLVVGSAVMFWKALMLVTKCESPIVVVLTGSMEPAYYRGDILFIHNREDKFNTGDVIVFKLKDHEIPIVHRTLVS
jgi:signal peptidase